MKTRKITALLLCAGMLISCAACSLTGRSSKKDDDDDDKSGWYSDILSSSESVETTAAPSQTTEAPTETTTETSSSNQTLPPAAVTEANRRLTELSHAEYYIDGYSMSDYYMRDLLRTARICMKFDPSYGCEYDGQYEKYDADEVANYIRAVFGLEIEQAYLEGLPAPIDDFDADLEPFYDGDYFYFYAADGELWSSIVIIDSYEIDSDGIVYADFTKYTIDWETAFDLSYDQYYEYCDLTAEEALADPTLTVSSHGTAEFLITAEGDMILALDFDTSN